MKLTKGSSKITKVRARSRGRWLKWLSPGLRVKRWLLLSVLGIALVLLGIAISARLTPVLNIGRLVSRLVDVLVDLLPRHISGPIAIVLGLVLFWWGQRRIMQSVVDTVSPATKDDLVDALFADRQLRRGAKIVAIGGGTGLSNLLRGLKKYSANITAIVTVADDGGSSGRLRREQGILPPGDIRNCLTALADEEKLVTELFQYRFTAGEGLSGHSFGNLFLAAMTDITGDLQKAIAASSQVLAVRGTVLPATLEQMVLWADLADGRHIEGESNITKAGGKIINFGCYPPSPKAVPEAIRAIAEADLIVIGPGSLYTSIIPNLLVPEILHALCTRQAPAIYVCNIMSQKGETDGYQASDYVKVLDSLAQTRLFDAILVQKEPPSPEILEHYHQTGSHFTQLDREELHHLECPIISANVMKVRNDGTVCHDPERLAGVLMRWYNSQY
ncbi:MAG: uridine diphosphate-N-acetylglucosamine-binding protein YvcK [Pseudanabaenaceae cyanobacterium]